MDIANATQIWLIPGFRHIQTGVKIKTKVNMRTWKCKAKLVILIL